MLDNKIDKTIIEIQSNIAFRNEFMVFSFVRDKIADVGLKFDVVVCGEENLRSTILETVKYLMLVYDKTVKISNKEIQGMFSFNKGVLSSD